MKMHWEKYWILSHLKNISENVFLRYFGFGKSENSSEVNFGKPLDLGENSFFCGNFCNFLIGNYLVKIWVKWGKAQLSMLNNKFSKFV